MLLIRVVGLCALAALPCRRRDDALRGGALITMPMPVPPEGAAFGGGGCVGGAIPVGSSDSSSLCSDPVETCGQCAAKKRTRTEKYDV